MFTEDTFRQMSYTAADNARAHFTDASIQRVLARGITGEQTWREVYDTLCGAVSAKERAGA